MRKSYQQEKTENGMKESLKGLPKDILIKKLKDIESSQLIVGLPWEEFNEGQLIDSIINLTVAPR